MEFLEGGSRGVYRPIRVLFDTPIYRRALQLCWHIQSYKSEIAVVIELLRLQKKNLISSQVTAEDMASLLFEESKSSLREGLWDFELQGFDEEEAKPLLKLVWAVNVRNKMRDVECQARMLLNSPEALPPNFQHPKVIGTAHYYAKILRGKQHEFPSSKRLCPSEVVMEVVPRVIHGFWVLPHSTTLNMPSQDISIMSVGVTKAVMNGVCSAVKDEGQAAFNRSMTDDMVLSIRTEIRQTWPNDVLVKGINGFEPELLNQLVKVTVGKICGLFQPQSPKVPAHLTPAVESADTTLADSNLTVPEEQSSPSPETNSAVLTSPQAPQTPTAVPLSTTNVQTEEDLMKTPCPKNDMEPAKEPDFVALPPPLTPPAESECIMIQFREDGNTNHNPKEDPQPSKELDSSVVPVLPAPPAEPDSAAIEAPLAPPTEPECIIIQSREDGQEIFNPKKDPEPSIELNSNVVPVPPSSPAEPLSTTKVQTGQDLMKKPCPKNDLEPAKEPGFAALPLPLTPPAEPECFMVQFREDGNTNHNPKEDPQPSKELDSSLVPVPLSPPAEPNSADIQAPLTPPTEPEYIIIQSREDGQEIFNPEKDPEPSIELNSNVVPVPPSSPAEPLSTTKVQTGEDLNMKLCQKNDMEPAKEPDFEALPLPLTPPAEPECFMVQFREDGNTNHNPKEDPQPSKELDSSLVPVPPAPPAEPDCAAIEAPLKPPAELHSNGIQTMEDGNTNPSPKKDPEPAIELNSNVVPVPLSPPAELPLKIQTRADGNNKPRLEKDTQNEPHSFPAPVTLPIEELVIVTVQIGLTTSLAEKEQPNSSPETDPAVSVTPSTPYTSPTQLSGINDVQDKEDDPKTESTTGGASAVVPASASALNPPLDSVVIVTLQSKKKRFQRFFRWLFKPVCCCFRAIERETD